MTIYSEADDLRKLFVGHFTVKGGLEYVICYPVKTTFALIVTYLSVLSCFSLQQNYIKHKSGLQCVFGYLQLKIVDIQI